MAAASPLNPLLPQPGPVDRSVLPRLRGMLVAALLVAWIPAGVVTLYELLPRLTQAEPQGATEVHPDLWRARVTLLEWRWSRPGVDVDRMFRRSPQP